MKFNDRYKQLTEGKAGKRLVMSFTIPAGQYIYYCKKARENYTRINGPAIFDKPFHNLFFYKDNMLHREDGPAMLLKRGQSVGYYLNNNRLTEDDFNVVTAKSRSEIANVLSKYF